MSNVIAGEVLFFFRAVVLGLVLMIAYDVLRIFRNVIPHGNGFIGLEDILYWLAVGIACFYFIFMENNGSIRWYALVGIGLGMLIWNFSLSPFIVKGLSFVLGKILRFLTFPLRFIGSKIKKFFRFVGKKLCLCGQNVRKLLKKKAESGTIDPGCEDNDSRKKKKKKKHK